MKLKWTDDDTGKSGISVTELERFDSPPIVSDFWLDARPIHLNNDRVAIASALIFGRNSLGSFRLPAHASPITSECIVELAKPGFRSVEPIEWYPKAVPEGDGVLRISEINSENRQIEIFGSDTINVINFYLLRTSQFAGALMGSGLVSIASNAWLFNRSSETDFIAAESLLAVAVLFAEDLGCTTIELHGNYLPFSLPINVIERMLEASRLTLLLS